jgi:hypothetical protein
VKDVIEETIEVFQPRYLDVGLDEVNYGPFGECEKCRHEKPSQLFLKSILMLHDTLAAKGVKMIMFQDTLLPSGNAYSSGTRDKSRGWEIVDQVPKDVIIGDWDYGLFDDKAKAQLEYFTPKGFSVLGATFGGPKGIQTFSAGLAQNPKSLGVISTHWYYARDWSQPITMAPECWFDQVLQAQYAWNTTNPPLKDIRYDPVRVMGRMIGPKDSLAEMRPWEPVLLETVFNGRISDEKDSWPGYGAGNSLAQVFVRDIVSDGVAFRMAGAKAGPNVLLLKGDEADGLTGTPVAIPVQRKAKRMAFLHSCNIPLSATTDWSSALSMPLIGKYQIHFEDGTSVDMPLIYRWNIVDWNNKIGVFEGRVAYADKTKAGSRIELIRTDWINPTPEKTIKSITVSTAANEGMSLALFAISTVN